MTGMLFLRLDGIEGEEPVGDDCQNAIEIAGYSHTLSMDIAAARPSAGVDVLHRRSTCQHDLFHVTKGLDKTSSKLLAACSNGITFKHAVVYLCRQDMNVLKQSSSAKPFMSIVMSDAILARFTYSFEDTWQMEQISFRYASIGWHIEWADPETGDAEKLEPVGWDGKLNKATEIAVPGGLKWKTSLL